jgi:hypothetical protein
MPEKFRPTNRPPLRDPKRAATSQRRPAAPEPVVEPMPTAYKVWAGVGGFGVLIIVVGLFFLGRPSGVVKGKVTFRGKPVYTGAVVIVGKDGVAAAGPIETDGSYVVQKVPVGDVAVGVISKDPVYLHHVTVLRSSRTPVPASAFRAPSGLDRRKWFPIPKEYEEPVRSGLSFSVKKGDNQYDIELK